MRKLLRTRGIHFHRNIYRFRGEFVEARSTHNLGDTLQFNGLVCAYQASNRLRCFEEELIIENQLIPRVTDSMTECRDRLVLTSCQV